MRLKDTSLYAKYESVELLDIPAIKIHYSHPFFMLILRRNKDFLDFFSLYIVLLIKQKKRLYIVIYVRAPAFLQLKANNAGLFLFLWRFIVDHSLIYVGKEFYEKLHEKLAKLSSVRRKEISVQIADARAQGDLGENAEYDAAKEAQAFNEMKIAEIQTKLAKMRIMDENAIPDNKAVLGTTVLLKDMDDGEEISYALVSEPEADL